MVFEDYLLYNPRATMQQQTALRNKNNFKIVGILPTISTFVVWGKQTIIKNIVLNFYATKS